MMRWNIDAPQLDWRQPWCWPGTYYYTMWVGAAIAGALLLSPWWWRSWQDWNDAQASQTHWAAQQKATQALRTQTTELQQVRNQTAVAWIDADMLGQSAQQQGLALSQLRSDRPQHSPVLSALHMQTLPVQVRVQGNWDSWLAWLAQWPTAAPGVTVASLELKADPRGGIDADVLAVVPQPIATDVRFAHASVSLEVLAPTDPFSSQAWLATQHAHAAQHPSYGRLVAPELLRARDVLEAYPSERLQYVGQIATQGEPEALIKVLPPTGAAKEVPMMSVHRVRVGHHLGQDFGKLLAVEDHQLVVQTLALSPTGEWQTHVVRWPLHEAVP